MNNCIHVHLGETAYIIYIYTQTYTQTLLFTVVYNLCQPNVLQNRQHGFSSALESLEAVENMEPPADLSGLNLDDLLLRDDDADSSVDDDVDDDDDGDAGQS